MNAGSSLAYLLSDLRADFRYFRWHSAPVRAQLIHMATNAEAEGVIGIPAPRPPFVAQEGAGHRGFRQRVDDAGNPVFRAGEIVDVEGKPITNSSGEAFDVIMPAFRTVSFSGTSEDFTTLRGLAERAGRITANLPALPQVHLMRDWRFSTPSDVWWALLFEMAWGNVHPLLVAERQLWIPAENPSAFLPYDLNQLESISSLHPGRHGIPPNWLKHLPEAWVSSLENVALASLDAAGMLLDALESDAAETSDESHTVPTSEGRVSDPVGMKRRFRVALSFPGEHRNLVVGVATALASALGRERVFYDKFHEVELAGLDLDLKLQRVYRDDSDLIVVFVCSEYEHKEWCGIEWRAIRGLMKDKSRPDTDIMFLRLDGEDVPGLLDIDGYLDIRDKAPQEVANSILLRWHATH